MTTISENPNPENLGPLRPTRAGSQEFPPVAKAYIQVSQVARDSGLLERAPRFYALVGAAIATVLGGVIVVSLLIGDSWFQLLIAVALAIIFTQIAFLAHEAAHRVILTSGPANDRLALLLAGLIGMSYTWWDSKHSRHHANPNRIGKDPDIDVDTISFVEEDAAQSRGLVRAITKHQGWLFFPLLTLEGLNLHMHSFVHLCSREPVKWRWTQIGIIAFRFAALLVPVFMLMPLGMSLSFLGVQFAVFGVYMGASFAPNHKGMPIVAHDAKLDFFSKQVRTSRNIKGGWWVTTLMGGLNYQVEHHLFPSMARPHLSKASKIIKEFCATHGVPYTETSLIESYSIVISYLNRVGLAARDPFECPIASQYGRAR